MQFHLIFTPEPEPTMSPLPEIPAEVTDLSAAISGLVGAVLLVLAGLAWRKANAWFAEVTADVKATKADVQTTKVQTTNSHDTNLRDDLTLAITEVQGLARAMKRVEEKQERMQSQQNAMHEDLRETRKDVRFTTEYVRDVDKRFIEHTNVERKTDGGNSG